MAVLTDNRETDRKDGELLAVPVKGSTTIYKGAQVAIDANGYLVPASDTAGLRAGMVAYEKVDNSAGADGALKCRVYRTGIFLLDATSITLAMVGDMMYVVDDQTFDDTVGTNGIMAGRLVEFVSTTKGWIDIEPAFEGSVAAQAAAIVSLTDGTLGTADDALVEITASYVEADIADNMADLAAKINAILAALRGAGIIAQ